MLNRVGHPSKFALWSQRWGNPSDDNQTYPTTVLLRHPTAPFMGTGTISNFEHDLQKAAHDYLVAANANPLIDPPLAATARMARCAGSGSAGGWRPLVRMVAVSSGLERNSR